MPGGWGSWGRDGRTPASSEDGDHDCPGSLAGRIVGAPGRCPYAARLAGRDAGSHPRLGRIERRPCPSTIPSYG